MNRKARWAGWILQGVILGGLLFLAILVMLSQAGETRLFRYQGF